LLIEVLHCGNSNFRRFWLLWFWPRRDDLHIRTKPVYHGDILDVWKWTSYVKAFESYSIKGGARMVDSGHVTKMAVTFDSP